MNSKLLVGFILCFLISIKSFSQSHFDTSSHNFHLTGIEFHRLLDPFEILNTNANEQRKSIVDMYIELFFIYKNFKGKRESYSLAQIDSMISGYKSSAAVSFNPLFKRGLKDILDAKKTDEEEIVKLKNGFLKMYLKLKEIKNNPASRYEKDGNLFYIVPEQVLQIE